MEAYNGGDSTHGNPNLGVKRVASPFSEHGATHLGAVEHGLHRQHGGDDQDLRRAVKLLSRQEHLVEGKVGGVGEVGVVGGRICRRGGPFITGRSVILTGRSAEGHGCAGP